MPLRGNLLAQELLNERRLSYARLAGNQSKKPTPPIRGVEKSPELHNFLMSADERRSWTDNGCGLSGKAFGVEFVEDANNVRSGRAKSRCSVQHSKNQVFNR